MRPLYKELASAIQAKKNCELSGNTEWFDKWEERIKLLTDRLPSGSGWDNGTKLSESESHAEKLVLYGSYHHMNGEGFYDGWTEHTVTVLPSFSGIRLRISGRDRNQIKDHLYETFEYALEQDVTYWILADRFPQFKIESKWEAEDGSPSQCYQCFYVNNSDGAARFWNNWTKAIEYAAECMHNAEMLESLSKPGREYPS